MANMASKQANSGSKIMAKKALIVGVTGIVGTRPGRASDLERLGGLRAVEAAAG
jgi:hypothetical protein